MNMKQIASVVAGLAAAALAAFVGWFAFAFIAWIVAIVIAALATLVASAAAYRYGCDFVASKLGVERPAFVPASIAAAVKARFAASVATPVTE